MKKKLGSRGWMAVPLLLSLFAIGCGSLPTSPDESIDGRTTLGLGVSGGNASMYTKIDQDWTSVNACWATSVDGHNVTVEIMSPAFTDSAGTQVFKYGSDYYYGLRNGNKVRVCPDLAALRHELSHLVGQAATGSIVQNGAGQCWL